MKLLKAILVLWRIKKPRSGVLGGGNNVRREITWKTSINYYFDKELEGSWEFQKHINMMIEVIQESLWLNFKKEVEGIGNQKSRPICICIYAAQ